MEIGTPEQTVIVEPIEEPTRVAEIRLKTGRRKSGAARRSNRSGEPWTDRHPHGRLLRLGLGTNAPLLITLEPQDRPVEIITLVGEQDADSAERIKNEIAVLLDSGSRIVVDLTDATFVGSQTLSVLLIGQHQAERASLGFTLALPQGNFTQLHRILRMTGLGSSFAIYATLQEAVAGARAGCTARRSVKVA